MQTYEGNLLQSKHYMVKTYTAYKHRQPRLVQAVHSTLQHAHDNDCRLSRHLPIHPSNWLAQLKEKDKLSVTACCTSLKTHAVLRYQTYIWENGVDLRSLQFACLLGSFLQITGLHLICQGRVICNDFCNSEQATSAAAARLSFLHIALQKAQARVQSLKQL